MGGQAERQSNESTIVPVRALAAKPSLSFLPSEEPGCGTSGKNEKIKKCYRGSPKQNLVTERALAPKAVCRGAACERPLGCASPSPPFSPSPVCSVNVQLNSNSPRKTKAEVSEKALRIWRRPSRCCLRLPAQLICVDH